MCMKKHFGIERGTKCSEEQNVLENWTLRLSEEDWLGVL